MSRQDRDDEGSARRQQAEANRRQGEANRQLELARQERRRGGIEIDRAHVAKAAADVEPLAPPRPFRGQLSEQEPADDLGAHLGALRMLLDELDDNGI